MLHSHLLTYQRVKAEQRFLFWKKVLTKKKNLNYKVTSWFCNNKHWFFSLLAYFGKWLLWSASIGLSRGLHSIKCFSVVTMPAKDCDTSNQVTMNEQHFLKWPVIIDLSPKPMQHTKASRSQPLAHLVGKLQLIWMYRNVGSKFKAYKFLNINLCSFHENF